MLGLMLQSHPRIAIPPENRFVLPTYLERHEFGDLNEEAGRRHLAERIVSRKQWFGDVGLNAGEMREQITSSATTVGSGLGLVLRAYADRFGKVRWGDKRPGYHAYIWAVQRMFPDAQFINIVRDGRDVVASMRTVPPWNETTSYRRILAWVEALDHAESAQAVLRSDSYFELQYEHLVEDPEKQLRPLCDFLGEPFDEAMLSPQSVAGQVVPERKHWHARTRQEVSSKSVGSFRERLEPWELSLCEVVMAEKLLKYGYDLSGAQPPAEEHLQEYRRVEAARLRRLTEERKADEARLDLQPVADAPGCEVQHQLDALERQVTNRTEQRDALRSRLDRVLASRSWRWTQPLRTAVKKTKRA